MASEHEIPPARANLLDRLRAILGLETLHQTDFELTEDMIFAYSWHNGYETVTIHHSSKPGGQNFSGAYHPNAICNGNPCYYCGYARP